MAGETKTPDAPARPPEPQATASVVQASAAPPTVSRWSVLAAHPGIQRLVAVLVFLLITAGFALIYLKTRGSAAPEPLTESVEPKLVVDVSLTVRELIKLGEGAISAQNFKNAEVFLDEARMRCPARETETLITIYNLLAAAADGRNMPNVGAAHRQFASGLRLRLGAALPLFDEAQRLLDEGEYTAARRFFASFLLRSSEVGPEAQRFIDEARRKLALTWTREIRTADVGVLASIVEPERFFDE